MHAFLEAHGYSTENFKMRYKNKPEARKEALKQGLTKLKLFSMLKRIYRSLCGKMDLRDTGQKRGFTVSERAKWLELKLRLYSFNPGTKY